MPSDDLVDMLWAPLALDEVTPHSFRKAATPSCVAHTLTILPSAVHD
jgi:hypothetical protein